METFDMAQQSHLWIALFLVFGNEGIDLAIVEWPDVFRYILHKCHLIGPEKFDIHTSLLRCHIRCGLAD